MSKKGTADKNQTPNWEQIAKDHQAGFTKASQKNAELEKQLAELRATKEVAITPLTISDELQVELDDLKDIDPDKWRQKLNSLEQEHKREYATKVKSATKEASDKLELARRGELLDDFISSPDTVLTLDRLDDIPVRLIKQLEKGEVTYENFLKEADKALQVGIAIKGVATPPNTPNLEDVGGSGDGATPTTMADLRKQAEAEIY